MPGQSKHIIQRGDNREVIFATDADYRFYVNKFDAACGKYDCEIYTYVLMTNHVHLLITPYHEAGIGKVMQSVGRCYVQYFNNTYGRMGTLWEGRCRPTLLDTGQYLLTCYHYIELDSVRAGLVGHPGEYPWSSYRFHAPGDTDQPLTPHALHERLGHSGPERRDAYRTRFRAHLRKQLLDENRETTNRAWVSGDDRFKAKVKVLLNRRMDPIARGHDRTLEGFRKTVKFHCV